jgi:hypothetical protein
MYRIICIKEVMTSILDKYLQDISEKNLYKNRVLSNMAYGINTMS